MIDDIDAMIDSVHHAKAGRRCTTCANIRLARAVARWRERVSAGEALPALDTMYRQLFRGMGAGSIGAVRYHVRNCLEEVS